MDQSNVTLRAPTTADAEAVGEVVFRAFASIADAHNFPRDFASAEFAAGLMRSLIAHPKYWGVVAETGGRVAACNFLDQRDEIGGIGPMCVHPEFQGMGLGRRLMKAVIERGRGMRGLRLVQDAFNTTSLSLYASLGFDSREPLALMTGRPRDARPDSNVRPMTDADVKACTVLCQEIHGISRANELHDAVAHFRPFVLERSGRISAYCTTPPLWLLNHAVAESEEDLRALLLGAAASIDAPLGLLVPMRQAGFFRWCLGQGLRVVKPMTLMSTGDYQEPRGAFFPSVIY